MKKNIEKLLDFIKNNWIFILLFTTLFITTFFWIKSDIENKYSILAFSAAMFIGLCSFIQNSKYKKMNDENSESINNKFIGLQSEIKDLTKELYLYTKKQFYPYVQLSYNYNTITSDNWIILFNQNIGEDRYNYLARSEQELTDMLKDTHYKVYIDINNISNNTIYKYDVESNVKIDSKYVQYNNLDYVKSYDKKSISIDGKNILLFLFPKEYFENRWDFDVKIKLKLQNAINEVFYENYTISIHWYNKTEVEAYMVNVSKDKNQL